MDTLSLSLIQYVFTNGEHEVKPAPHRNAKHSEGYVRTMPSTLSKLKATASASTAKRALAFVSEIEGGIEHAKRRVKAIRAVMHLYGWSMVHHFL